MKATQTASASTGVATSLEPVRRALLEDARHAADEIVADARRVADERVAAAQEEADEAIDEVRRRVEATAAARAEQARERARRAAHASVLRAHDELRHELVERVRLAMGELRRDPRYPALLDRLERMARDQLGSGTEIERDPDPDGGVVGSVGGRRVDYRLPALADRAVAAIADEVVTLWS